MAGPPVKSLALCCPQDPLQAEDPVPFVANIACVAGDACARLVLSMNVAAYCLVPVTKEIQSRTDYIWLFPLLIELVRCACAVSFSLTASVGLDGKSSNDTSIFSASCVI